MMHTKDIRGIISEASTELMIVDPYVDSTIFELLKNAQPTVQIQVLTRHMEGDFQLAGKKFKEQREKSGGSALTVRTEGGDFHDRFIVADGRVFHLGASIEDAGKKVFAMSEIEASRNKEVLIENISKSWHTACEIF